ncbi:Ff.00g021790.m01.CDS01 [Fusarium sp. VM40]|nr:Ff.00g021790.m01.CDS01 [Fusarium sp. VM40]
MSKTESSKPKREMQVLSLGLPRTGTASMAEALTVLGYKDVYHGIKSIDNKEDWAILEKAADASFPNLPSYTGRPFTREQWDELWGHCEAVTDVASVFAPQLIGSYPDAKVILVIREYDAWFKSMDEGVLKALWSPIGQFSINYIEPVIGSVAGRAATKQMQGLFQAKDAQEARQKGREAYDRHHRVIKEMTPRERLLVYRLGDGWGPICEFLGKPVPEQEFPWVNEAAELRRVISVKIKRNIQEAVVVALPWVGAAAAVGVGFWMVYKR